MSDNTIHVALVGGPCDGHWYTETDFQAQQTAAARMGNTAEQIPGWSLSYTPTTTSVAHPTRPKISAATAWTWTGPAHITSLHQLAQPGPVSTQPRRPSGPGAVPRSGSARVLVTGSRDWKDRDAIAGDLAQWRGAGVVLVHGAAPGADRIAAQIWRSWGLPDEPHPAGWTVCGRGCRPGHRLSRRDGSQYCPTAGRRRNAEMVAAGAQVCLAFIRRHSRGATHCATTAETAGIPTTIHEAT